jgi:hypothetical protein
LIEKILAEASKYGTVTIRRNYGDWTTANMGGWKDTLQTYAISPSSNSVIPLGKMPLIPP